MHAVNTRLTYVGSSSSSVAYSNYFIASDYLINTITRTHACTARTSPPTPCPQCQRIIHQLIESECQLGGITTDPYSGTHQIHNQPRIMPYVSHYAQPNTCVCADVTPSCHTQSQPYWRLTNTHSLRMHRHKCPMDARDILQDTGTHVRMLYSLRIICPPNMLTQHRQHNPRFLPYISHLYTLLLPGPQPQKLTHKKVE